MKIHLLTLATLVLVATGCSKTDTETPDTKRTFTLTAALPADKPESRALLKENGATPRGLVMKWETADTLYLNFKYNGNFYRTKAPIVPGSISADTTKASFTVTIPEGIPTGAAFDLYGVYQKVSTWGENDGGYFEKGQNNNIYVCEQSEEECITLNKMGDLQSGVMRPVLTFKQKGITAPNIAPIAFEHRGWMMALHLKNASDAEITLPNKLLFQYETESASSFIYNGYHGTNIVKIDLDNDAVSATSPDWRNKACVYFINGFDWNPLYGQKLGAGKTIVLYRWLIGTPAIDKMYGEGNISGVDRNTKDSPDGQFLPAKTVEKGKVYHTYMTWDGTHLKITDKNGTPL